ncbi:Mov34/MPN/PAD-1 family protein [Pandoraea sp. E26]|uniref:Mov34/MPN/PAD-1 family protein n=1 Tax=Pandoraea sp. E26 TaxID=1427365 RepID=UPI00048FA254|nr:Mov34/MPN/PAD-1 family protein [Pandoraea sp. E26]
MKFGTWFIPIAVLEQTERAFISGNHEVFVIWTASASQNPLVDANVLRSVVPQQQPGETPTGVYVHIPGAELQRIQVDNYARGERSVVQLHTHPGPDVRMSDLDREWEVVRHVGALSIIVPFYGRGGLSSFDGANVYEREEAGWRLWTPAEASTRLVRV